MNANPHAYEMLVAEGGTPTMARELLEGVQPGQLLTDPAASPVGAYTMLAALWLWHDGLSECHEIVQKSLEQLTSAALNLHSKPSKTSPIVPSVPFVENDKSSHPQYLRDMASTLAFWHAIMHRREGDFSNSKYWYAKVGRHAALDVLAVQAGSMGGDMPADKSILRIVIRGFDPNALVDLVEQVHDKPSDPRHGAAVRLQQLEWRTLFDFCMRG
jgi:hypothetical protein